MCGVNLWNPQYYIIIISLYNIIVNMLHVNRPTIIVCVCVCVCLCVCLCVCVCTRGSFMTPIGRPVVSCVSHSTPIQSTLCAARRSTCRLLEMFYKYGRWMWRWFSFRKVGLIVQARAVINSNVKHHCRCVLKYRPISRMEFKSRPIIFLVTIFLMFDPS